MRGALLILALAVPSLPAEAQQDWSSLTLDCTVEVAPATTGGAWERQRILIKMEREPPAVAITLPRAKPVLALGLYSEGVSGYGGVVYADDGPAQEFSLSGITGDLLLWRGRRSETDQIELSGTCERVERRF